MRGHNAQVARRIIYEMHEFCAAGAKAVVNSIIEINNAGAAGSPPAPVDKHELRGSPRITLGSPSSEKSIKGTSHRLRNRADVDAAFSGFRLGTKIWIKWIAKHANIIEDGRRLSRTGRMIGSKQAPEGWVRQAIAVTKVRMRRWKFASRGRAGGAL